jgi:hypothetical protein
MPDTPESLRAGLEAALKSGNQTQMEAVDARYKQLYGDKPVDLSAGVTVGPPPSAEEADDSYTQQSIAESDRVLRAELGDQFESTIQQARETALELVGETFKDGAKADQVLDSIMAGILAAGGDALEINRLMIAISRRVRASK